MPSENAMGVAVRLWCEPTTEKIVMAPALAELFAKRVDLYHDLIESAWGLIANAHHGDWDEATSPWREAAVRWRDRYHAMLDMDLVDISHHPGLAPGREDPVGRRHSLPDAEVVPAEDPEVTRARAQRRKQQGW